MYLVRAPGCAVIVMVGGKPSGTCAETPTCAGQLWFPHPPPGHYSTAYFCEQHRGLATRTRPLTVDDLDRLARRRADAAHWARVLEESRIQAGWQR